MEYRISPPKPDNTVVILGVDMGARPIWWYSRPEKPEQLRNGDTIVLKIPGSTQWAARWSMKYYGAHFEVFRILRIDAEGNFVCESIADFPIRKK